MPKTKKSASPEQTGDADRFDITMNWLPVGFQFATIGFKAVLLCK
jgi:hypothetical protein